MKTSALLVVLTGASRQRRATDFYGDAIELNRFYDETASHFDGAYGCFCNFIQGDRQFSQPGFGSRPLDASDAVCKAHKDCLACVREEFGEECIPEGFDMRYTHEDGQCTNEQGTCKRALCECQKQFAIDHAKVKDTRNNGPFHWFIDGGIGPAPFQNEICPNACPTKDLVIASSTTSLSGSRFSLHSEFYNNNHCFENTQSGVMIRFSGENWQIVADDVVLLEAEDSFSCPDKISKWMDGDGISQTIRFASGTASPGEKRCCKNNDGGFKLFNDGNQQCCDDGSVKPIGNC